MYSKWLVYKSMSFNFDLAREYVKYFFIRIMRENWMIYIPHNEKYVNYNFFQISTNRRCERKRQQWIKSS